MEITRRVRLDTELTLAELYDFHITTGAEIEIDKGIPYWILMRIKVDNPKIDCWDYLGVEKSG